MTLRPTDLDALSEHEWAAINEAHARKEARLRAWECRLHGLKHRSGRALSEEDFVPHVWRNTGQTDAEQVAAWRHFKSLYEARAQATVSSD